MKSHDDDKICGVLGTVLSAFGEIMRCAREPYESRMIARDVGINGLNVSTTWAEDVGGYETAILDAKAAYPVERYRTRDEALAGHLKWVVRCEAGLSEVMRLGYGCVESKRIALVPNYSSCDLFQDEHDTR